MRYTSILVILIASRVATPAGAQTSTAEKPPSSRPAASGLAAATKGRRVRILAPEISGKPITGIVADWRSDTLLLAPRKFGDAYTTIPRSDLSSLEISRGSRSYTGVGALVGLAAGLGVGLVVASDNSGPRPCPYFECLSEIREDAKAAGLTVITGGLAGSLVGAFIGSNIRSERWEALPLQPVGLSLRVDGRAGAGIVLSLPTRF